MSEAASRTIARFEDREGNKRLLLTVMEAAHRLGIGRSLMYELLASGSVASIRVGRLRRVPCDALADFVRDGRN